MKSLFIFGLFAGTVLSLSGCYTVLMTPSAFESGSDSNDEYAAGSASAAELNYGSNCLSCHSQSELDDRYDEMQSLGIHTVHGMVVDPYGWRNPSTSIPWWYNVYAPPPVGASSASQPSGGRTSQPRTRAVGSTRGGSTSTNASPAPQAPSGNSSSAPAAGNASSASQQSQQTAQPAQPQGRQRSGSDSSGTTRKTGSTRGSGR
ncbi:MAG: hypothetical protein KGJ59_09695 [Bacteroidota bacterium]|nr:hypothetical protein [Bacteroidota bacterium]